MVKTGAYKRAKKAARADNQWTTGNGQWIMGKNKNPKTNTNNFNAWLQL
ncbi:MAG TPA: hypothetical protein VF008_16325 [Niastella sp.]